MIRGELEGIRLTVLENNQLKNIRSIGSGHQNIGNLSTIRVLKKNKKITSKHTFFR